VLQLSAMSPRAVYYLADDELRHRVLFVDGYMGHAGCDHALRLVHSSVTRFIEALWCPRCCQGDEKGKPYLDVLPICQKDGPASPVACAAGGGCF
jgi:hypothetical protein